MRATKTVQCRIRTVERHVIQRYAVLCSLLWCYMNTDSNCMVQCSALRRVAVEYYIRLLVEWAANGFRATIQDMGIDHGGLHVLMPEQFLHGPNIVCRLLQLSGERVPTLIDTLLIIPRWPRSVTRTIPSADNQWRLSAGDDASPRRVSSSSCLMASRLPLPRGCSTPSLVVSSKTHLPPA